MSFSKEVQEKMEQFAKEQSRCYLDAAEMTYMEKLRMKADQAKGKVGRKLSRFRNTSDEAREAQDDMVLYMSDYMNDLMSGGMSEADAFSKAKQEMSASGVSEIAAGLHERFQQYYEHLDPTVHEATGLFYGGFLFIGFVAGALLGYVLGGGRHAFMDGGWVDTAVGAVAGMLLGLGIGQVFGAVTSMKNRK